jgi:hypothetical protein
MPMIPSAVDVVTLAGVRLPRAAVQLAIDLERRGIRLRSDGGTVLLVVAPPDEELTTEDQAGLTRWSTPLLALVDAVARQGVM